MATTSAYKEIRVATSVSNRDIMSRREKVATTFSCRDISSTDKEVATSLSCRDTRNEEQWSRHQHDVATSHTRKVGCDIIQLSRHQIALKTGRDVRKRSRHQLRRLEVATSSDSRDNKSNEMRSRRQSEVATSTALTRRSRRQRSRHPLQILEVTTSEVKTRGRDVNKMS